MTEQKQYEDIVQKIAKQNEEPEWLLKKRLAALHIFKEKPMPNFVYGLNINLDVDLNLDEIDISKDKGLLKEFEGQGFIVQALKTALNENPEIIKDHFMTDCVPAQDKFTTLHNAFVQTVIILTIPKNQELTKPIEISSIIENEVVFDHLIIIAEENTKATIVDHVSSKDISKGYSSKIIEIYAKEGAKIDYGSVQDLNKDLHHFTIKRANLHKNATVNWLDFCFGSKVTLSEVSSNLNEEGAETNNHGVFFGTEGQQFDMVTNSIHNAPNTFSDIFMKGTLTENGKCLYRGLVKINQNAGASNGYQQQDTIILSPEAAADSIPNLEIDNSDVKCSHGATIGKIDTEKLFYLQSRGLNEQEATREYVKGFFEPLIRKMKIEKLRDSMHQLVEERMK